MVSVNDGRTRETESQRQSFVSYNIRNPSTIVQESEIEQQKG